ncbi:MAG: TonB family protein [bacterium]|nr:TonB family protein [bacterium]
MRKEKRNLFLQALLISLLGNLTIVLVLANYAETAAPLAPPRGAQELANLEVLKPPPLTIKVPEIKPPPRTIQAAPEPSDDPDAVGTYRTPIIEYIPVETDPDLWPDINPDVHNPDPTQRYTPPKAVFAPEPEYPQLLKEAGWSGSCTVGLYISEKGEILKVWILRSSGKAEADLAALAAAESSRWEPASEAGFDIPKSICVTYEFLVDVR